ncbi:hypothetical protein H1D32_13375 [Anaerobacillus sp. CMMVII]|uniref:hypothetical protein n=1 Tax=Anaerobacillus sp. CMMVII TaxID=2755588 RepID=UPI0021B80547|nr:hypothetical protein [Anaerobacillus sp. CMMVII]MCT8138645.1 hypothetical protein [Anaerobacillus sp. CMMVII]
MARHVFTFEKPYEEFEVNGKVYQVHYDDDSMESYRKQALVYKNGVEQFITVDLDQISAEEQEELKENAEKLTTDLIEMFFGKGTFNEIYEVSGRSYINVSNLLRFMFDWVNTKIGNLEQIKKDYYTAIKK